MNKAAIVEDLLVLAGGLVLLYGTWMVSTPLALAVGGLSLIGLGAVVHVSRKRGRNAE